MRYKPMDWIGIIEWHRTNRILPCSEPLSFRDFKKRYYANIAEAWEKGGYSDNLNADNFIPAVIDFIEQQYNYYVLITTSRKRNS